MLIVAVSIFSAYLLRFNFSIPQEEYWFRKLPLAIICVVSVRAILSYIGKTYAGIVRYTSAADAQRIFLVSLTGTLILSLINFISHYYVHKFFIPFSILIIDFITTVFVMTSGRLMVKELHAQLINTSSLRRSVIIYGTEHYALISKTALDRDTGSRYKVLAFIDDNQSKGSRKLGGIPVYDLAQLDTLLKKNEVVHVIISTPEIAPSKKQYIAEICLKHNTRVLNVPAPSSWINGELSFKQIRTINIDDLLERDTIKLDKEKIQIKLENKVVLITGAAGSIGSELVRQIILFHPAKLILLDIAETQLYDLELDLQENYHFINYEIILGDIRNRERIESLFEQYRPQVVFHAAAYKHVPMLENNPSEAIITNIQGTINMADMASKYCVTEFVMISTDKAVNPTGIMGASKRIAEIYIQSLNAITHTHFITTRFGNVLGSNGSVIPRFKSQIEKGGPITLTHPEITRYFMTIPEACQLVIEAGAMGKGGEIFIFDMGQSIKILDLAHKMITLAKLKVDKDIKIVYTGLRPGEKLYEELLNKEEHTLPTHHPRIMIAKVREYEFSQVSQEIKYLVTLAYKGNSTEVVRKMKTIVPEYVSNNSPYEELDKINS